MEITLLLSDFLDRDSRLRSVYFKDRKGQIYYATRNAYKVLDEDAFRYWTGKEDEEGIFRFCPPIWTIIFRIPGIRSLPSGAVIRISPP